MSFLGLDITTIELLIIINVAVVIMAFFAIVQAFRGMRQQEKQELIEKHKMMERRRHEYRPNDYPQQRQETIEQETPVNGNDIQVLSKKLCRKSATQKISENIGDA